MTRYVVYGITVALALICLIGAIWVGWLLIPGLILALLSAIGTHDLLQRRHSILRNYPVLGHMRFLFEGIRPEIRQYLIESDQDEEPFSRETRSLVYQRAKGVEDKRPFGTRRRVYDSGYEWLTHSAMPIHIEDYDFRVKIGGPDCKQPYDASVFNISAMSFGALSANAILALNNGAKMGGFAHDTGEGGISRYHRQGGGDLIYEIGSGYFGCRTRDGRFDPDKFREQALDPQVKMIELKLSQGAKPGHGGMLPAAKITPEIAEARGVPMGVDCISPARHPEFSNPIEMMQFIGRLRELSDGKPVGFKLCVGHAHEFLAIVKAMLQTGITPDFIVIDGKEGGTGAAPSEFIDHIGMPLREGLTFVHYALIGANLRDRIRLGASGMIISAFDIARVMALGADWCNMARGFMFAVGCIQSQACHTDKCPVGVATQDPDRQRALVVADKSVRVAQFHGKTLEALAEVVAGAGLRHPSEFETYHFHKRVSYSQVTTFTNLYPPLAPGELLSGTNDSRYKIPWQVARADTFHASALHA